MEKDFRCYTLHFFFRIEGAEIYNGGKGYACTSMDYCKKLMSEITVEYFNELTEIHRQLIANQVKVPIESVIQVDSIEYFEHTESKEKREEFEE